MAAGLGFKDFTTGEVLTAADVDGYLMQGIWVFASNAARDAAVTAPAEGNFAFTKDTNSLWYYDGAAWVASGATGDIEGVTAGVGISGGGTSGTVTVTNSMATAITTAGDTLYGTGSGTFSRLGIGTAGQVLKVNSGATAPEWGAAGGASGLTLIKRASFSNVAGTSTTFDDVFSSTYQAYQIVVEKIYATTATDDLQFQLRYAGPTTQTTGYNGNLITMIYNSTTVTGVSVNAATQSTLNTEIGNVTSGQNSSAIFTVFCPNDNATRVRINGGGTDTGNGVMSFFGQFNDTLRTYTGFLLKSSSTNITGTVSVYGLAIA